VPRAHRSWSDWGAAATVGQDKLRSRIRRLSMQVASWARGTASGRRSPTPNSRSNSTENVFGVLSKTSSMTSLPTPASGASELEGIPEVIEASPTQEVPVGATSMCNSSSSGAATLSPPEAHAPLPSTQRQARSPARLGSRFRSPMTYFRSQSADVMVTSLTTTPASGSGPAPPPQAAPPSS
jgi:hypothetical protein